MANQRGSSPAGVSGVINAPGVTGATIEYRGECLAWSYRNAGQPRPRGGRGTTGKYFGLRIAGKEGGGIIKGEIASNAWPAPDNELEGATISIVRTFASSKTVTTPAVVTSFEQTFSDKTSDIADFALAYTVTGAPIYAGWSGTQPTAATPSKSDQQQWLGTIKGYDPDGIAPPETTSTIDWWSDIANSDAAEKTKLLAVVSAAVPPLDTPHNYKLRGASFGRDCIDGGTIVLSWALTTSAEDWLNARTQATADPQNLTDSATVAAINATPATPAGLVDRGVTSVEINDSKTGYVKQAGLRSTKDDVEMPATVYDVDQAGIWGQASVRKVQDTDAISWPATPSSPADLKRGRVDKTQLHGGKWALTYHFVRNNSEDVIELDGAHTSADPNDFDETATVIIVDTSSSPPTTPDAPVGQLINSDTVPLTRTNGSYSGYYAHRFYYGPTTRLQAITFRGKLIVDPTQINDADVQVTVTTTSSPGETPSPGTADLKLVRRTTQRQQGTPEKWVHIWEFARNTAEDEREHKSRRVDPDDFGETERIPILHTSETSSPGTPTQIGTTSNLIGTDVERLCVANGSFTGLWLWTFIFGPNTRKQEIEQQGGITVDPTLLDDDDVQTLTSSSSANPGTPAARIASQVLIRRTARRVQDTPQKWEHKYYYGYRLSTEKLVADRTETSADVSALESTAVTAEVWDVDGGGPPETPTLTGYVLRFKRDVETNNPTYRLRIYTWGLRTTEQDITLPGTVNQDDASNLADEATRTQINSSSTYPVAFDTPPLGLKLRTVFSEQLTDGGKWKHKAEYGRRNREDDVEQGQTVYEFDQSTNAVTGEARVAVIEADGTPDGGVSVTGLVLRDIEKRQTHDSKWVITYVFGVRTHEQDITYLQSKRTAEPGALRQQDIVVEITANETPAPQTVQDGTNLIYHSTESHRITATKWVHAHLYKVFTPIEEVQEDGRLSVDDPVSFMVGDDHFRRVTANQVASPDTIAGRVCVRRTVKRIGRLRWQHDFYYDLKSHAQKLEDERYRTSEDPAGLDSEEVQAQIYPTGNQVLSVPSPTASGVQLVDTSDYTTPSPDYFIRVWRWATLTPRDKLILPHHSTTTDASELESEAERAILDGETLTGPGGSYVLRDTIVQQITHPSYGNRTRTIYKYGLTTREQDLTYKATEAEANPLTGYESEIATILTDSSSAQSIANAALASNQSDETFLGVQVKRITPTKALQILKYSGEDKAILNHSNHVVREAVRGVPQTAIVNNTYLPGNISTSDSEAIVVIFFNGGDLRVRPQYIYRALGRFTLRRVFSADTTAGEGGDPPAWTSYLHLANRGTANQLEFLGYSAGEVMYMGPSAAYSFNLNGARRLIVDYQFATDNYKHFNDGLLPEGRTAVSAFGVTILSSGLYPATHFDLQQACKFPAQTNFTGFID